MRKSILRTLLLTILLFALLSVPAYAETATLTGDDVNLRSGPGMQYEVLGCFEKGTEVTIHDRSNAEWYSVTVNGVRGFMSSSYLSLNGGETSVQPTETVTAPSGDAGYINAMYVRFRSGASLDASILGEYNTGTALTITGTTGEWTAVIISGSSGYVHSSYVSRGTAPAAPQPAQETQTQTTETPSDGTNAVLIKDDAFLFTEPSFYSTVRGSFNKGERLTVNEVNGDWATVIIYGYPGYIYMGNISLDSDPKPAETAAPAPAPAATPAPTPAPTPTPAPSDGTNAVLIKDDAYLFNAPSFYSTIRGAFNKGERLTVNEVNGDWATVIIYGYPGYINMANISLDSDPKPVETSAPAATPAPTPAPTPTPAPASSDGTNAVLCKDDVYLYTAPSFYSSIRGAFNKGERLIVNEVNGDWATVVIQGYPGYINMANISRDTDPKPEATPTPATPDSKSGYVNAYHVHLRSEPSTSSAIKGIFDKNAALTITGTTGDWVAVTIQGMSGYIYKDYVSVNETPEPTPAPEPTPTPAATSGEEGYIKGNNVRMRSEPSMNGEILGEYNAGTKLTITGTSGEWTAVILGGKAGYIYSTYVGRGEITVPSNPVDAYDEGVQMAQFALQFVGYPYVWAGTSPDVGFDCSGLACYTYRHFGYNMYRVANDQTRNGVHVDASDLQPGDLLCFYSGGSYVGHVGIYIGDGKFVHASTYTTGVIISELSGYYTTRGFEARRIAGTAKDGPGDY